MDSFDSISTISITELQKLSLKQLRRRKLPLLVVDRKSKRQGFVILDVETYEKFNKKEARKERKSIPDYHNMGLLWDREMSNQEFEKRIRNSDHSEHRWAVKRLFEHARSTFITEHFALDEIQTMLRGVDLRSFVQEAWRHALHYWSENP